MTAIITAKLWGGGGSGAAGLAVHAGGGGGGGFAQGTGLTVTANSYTVIVGAGGATVTIPGAPNGNGLDGSFSRFTTEIDLLTATGGKGGTFTVGGPPFGTGGLGGTGIDGMHGSGTFTAHNGGTPGDDVSAPTGGGGGAGSAGDGGNVANNTTTGGVGGTPDGGAGGNAGSGGGVPFGTTTSGSFPSGGGGANRGGSSPNVSGAGANGQVIISYAADGSDGVSVTSTGGTITIVGGQQIHTFSTPGTYTFTVVLSVPLTISVSTSVLNIIANFVNLIFSDNPKEQDFSATVSTSNYKWETPTLITAQQQTAVRPAFQCFIKDDTIQADVIYTMPSPTSGIPDLGSCVTAPDGSILRVGQNRSDGTLGFWKITDGSTNAAWNRSPDVIITSSWNNTLQTDIAVSAYINNTYIIDIYYYNTSGPNNTIYLARSSDGGNTFTIISTGTVLNNTDVNTPFSISSGVPLLQADGSVDGISFFGNNSNVLTQSGIHYIYYDSSLNTFTNVRWGGQPASPDFIIHSLSNYYDGSGYNVVFSGYHSYTEIQKNYSLYTTKLFNTITLSATTDVWSFPTEVLTSLSNSSQNENSFTCPKLNFDGTYLWLTFRGNVVQSVSENGGVITQIGYYQCQSTDFLNYSYPNQIIFKDGTILTSNVLYTEPYSWVLQNGYYYFSGGDAVWRYIQNNIIANVSDYVIRYAVNVSAGQPETITLQIGNQNGQWVGSTPTLTGYQAITANRKIILYQGYYNSLGVAEYVPKNTYYIDDVQQSITTSDNTLIIQGRDILKKESTTISRFAYNFNGPNYIADTLDSSTTSNWNQANGIWLGNNGFMYLVSPSQGDNVIVYNGLNLSKNTIEMTASLSLPDPSGTTSVFFYPYYINGSEWVRLNISGNGSGLYNWKIEFSHNGVIGIYAFANGVSFGFTWSSAQPFTRVQVRIVNYTNYSFTISNQQGATGNEIYQFGGYNLIDELELTPLVTGSPITIAIGVNGYFGPIFSSLKVVQMDNQQSIGQLIKKVSTKANIFNYIDEYLFQDYFYDKSVWNLATGSSFINRNLVTTSKAFLNTTLLTDGELEFVAKCTPTDIFAESGFNLYFRSQSTNPNDTHDGYTLYFSKKLSSGGNPDQTGIDLINTSSGTSYILYRTNQQNVSTGFYSYNNLNFDLSQYHTYRVTFVNSWITVYIDGIEVLAWNDNNINESWGIGYIGFGANNSTLNVKYIRSLLLYNIIDSFAINPGDDIQSAMAQLIQSRQIWNFTDLFGRFKSILLQTTDTTNYSYNEQILSQNVDNSDKELVNQVTVIGQGVSAIANTGTSISLSGVRDLVVVDYKIVTLADAQARANLELQNAQKYQTQSTPLQINNPGSEIFDIVTVINTGPNASGVNQNVRIYNQSQKIDGSSNEYSISLGTGKQ